MLGVLAGTVTPEREGKWPLRYAVRRIAWHACDHLFEIEDRVAARRRRRPVRGARSRSRAERVPRRALS